MSDLLNPDALFSAPNSCLTERVEIPEWNCHVFVRQLTALEWDQWETTINRTRTKNGKRVTDLNLSNGGVRARFATLVCCDADGKPIFKPAQAEMLGAKKPPSALDKIWDAGYRLNGKDESDEQAEKNSAAADRPIFEDPSP